jgi:hypothetical protein
MTRRKHPPAEQAADDLEILHPEREIELAGRKLTMREFGFVEGLRLAGQVAPIVHDLAALEPDDVGGGAFEYAKLQALFGAHADAIEALIAQACDQPAAWVHALGDADGQALLIVWWAVNGPFFVRRLALELQMRAVARPSPGARSTTPSAATSDGSGNTRVVN